MKYKKKKKFPFFITISVSLLIGFLIGYLVGFKYGLKLTRSTFFSSNSPTFSTQSLQGNLNPEVRDVIEKLNCICGCKRELLACSCQEPRGSTEIKLYAQELINGGLSKSEAIKQIVERYGSDVLKERNS